MAEGSRELWSWWSTTYHFWVFLIKVFEIQGDKNNYKVRPSKSNRMKTVNQSLLNRNLHAISCDVRGRRSTSRPSFNFISPSVPHHQWIHFQTTIIVLPCACECKYCNRFHLLRIRKMLRRKEIWCVRCSLPTAHLIAELHLSLDLSHHQSSSILTQSQ